MTTPDKPRSFDELMKEIETLSAKLESGTVNLEESLSIFEQASGCIAEAKQRLKDLDHRFEMLTDSFNENSTGKEE